MNDKLKSIFTGFELTSIYNRYKNEMTYEEQQAMLKAIKLQNLNIQQVFAEMNLDESIILQNEIDNKDFQEHIKRMLVKEISKLIYNNMDFNRDIETHKDNYRTYFKTKLFIECK